MFLMRARLDIGYYLLHIILPEAVYTIVVAFIFYPLLFAAAQMALVCGSREYRIIVEKKFREFLINFISSRTFFLYVMFVVMAVLLFQRIFTLQIVQGEDKQQEFELKIKKERSIASTRGNIYDVNGIALAYNELSSSVTIEDVYESSKKNATINGILKKVLHILDENGDSISCDFNIYIDGDGGLPHSVTGSRRLRFYR